jgi:hypothetical protein
MKSKFSRSRKIQEVEVFKKSKIEEVKDLKFGDSTRVCNSSWVSGAIDKGMPFGYSQISIPGLTHYGSGQVQGLEDYLEAKKEGSNPYSTRTLVNP